MDPNQVRPMGDGVLLLRIAEERTSGGIILTAPKDEMKAIKARVISVGNGKRQPDGQRIPMPVCAGDIVLIPNFGPATKGRMRIYGEMNSHEQEQAENYFIVPCDQILAVLEIQ